jgi:hypothetical protein
MGCNSAEYLKAPMYWAAIQAWIPTSENRHFAKEFLDMMMDPKVAGPSNRLEFPEGVNGCKAHRNDQSVLSVLIHKYGWQQPYNIETWARYGDYDTIQTTAPSPVIKGRCGLNTPLVIKTDVPKWTQKLGVVISFCTNDIEFFEPCIHEVQQFATEIVVSYGNTFFDGTLEQLDVIYALQKRHPGVKFVEFSVEQIKDARRNHNIQRYAGLQALGAVDYVMFLDVDEIIEGPEFKKWWQVQCASTERPAAMRLATYYYCFSPALRADEIDQTAIIIKRTALDGMSQKFLYEVASERDTILKSIKDYKEFIVGVDNNIMSHHYCLVRTKDEMLKKVKSWGHRKDKEWELLINRFYGRLGNPQARGNHFICRCLVCHAHQKVIRYGDDNKMVLRPHTPVELVLNTADRVRLRSEGCDIIEREHLRSENGVITDFWHGFSYSLVQPYIQSTKYTVDHIELSRLFHLDTLPIDKTKEIS